MKHTINVDLNSRGYPIIVADTDDEAWKEPLAALLQGRTVAVISDENVSGHYRQRLDVVLSAIGCRNHFWLIVEPGERSKSLAVVERLYSGLLDHVFGRDGVVLALGGGVVGDLAGFVAATIHRGVDFIQLPTSLMAMVDSAIGGKTGVNHSAGKNLVGAFHQPRAVLANLLTLDTLPKREIACGLAEVIKYGVIADPELFARLEERASTLLSDAGRALLDIVVTSATIKADIVAQDERESGLRMLLNFGHTLGHAVENTSGYGSFHHGEAIAVGMVLAAKLGGVLGITPESVEGKIRNLCDALGLPTEIGPDHVSELSRVVAHDKKVRGDHVKFILAKGIGDAEIVPIPLAQLVGILEAWGGEEKHGA
ncbi:MAG: 3-dehydroquinate synthase [Myxococcales bacterium]|nr:3-dehydroquinate synthase [Myxococcales bacterium]